MEAKLILPNTCLELEISYALVLCVLFHEIVVDFSSQCIYNAGTDFSPTYNELQRVSQP